MGGVDDVGLDHQVFVEELSRKRVVGVDAADLGGGEKHDIGLALADPGANLRLLAQIRRAAFDRQDLAILGRQPAHDRRADHAAMAGDPDLLAGERKDVLRHG